MKMNKKYSIRKLTVGIASISIGLFVANSIDLQQLANVNLANNIIKAEGTDVKNWQPEGNVIAQGEDGVPWELYENGYLLFKPVEGKDTLTNNGRIDLPSWKEKYHDQIKAIGFTSKTYAPVNSSYLFIGDRHDWEDFPKKLSNLSYIDASKLDTSKVENVQYMFYRARGLTNLDIGKWDTSKVTNMGGMFSGARGLTNLDLSKWNTSKVTNMGGMFSETWLTNLDIGGWDTSKVTNMGGMFNEARGLKNLDLSRWDTSQVMNMGSMFSEASGLTNLDIGKWDTSKVTNMGGMFNEARGLTNLDIGKWDTSQVMNMRWMFSEASGLTNLDIGKWDTSKVTDMSRMFYGTRASLDIGKWDTSQVTNMEYMFNGAKGLTNLDLSRWDTSKVRNMRWMFAVAGDVRNLNIGKWDTSQVVDMGYMFYGTWLANLDLGKWDTSQVMNMELMFARAFDLTNSNIGKWDTSKVTNMEGMFAEAGGLVNLDIGKWDTSKVTNMGWMFSGARGLTNLDIGKWDTSKVTDMKGMFSEASGLTNLDVSKWNVSKVEDMSYMFEKTPNLVNVNTGENLKVIKALVEAKGENERWVREDKTYGPYTSKELYEKYKENPSALAGRWVLGKNSYTINFNSDTGESIEALESKTNETITLPTLTQDKPGYKFLGWSKIQDGEVVTDKVNLANPGETITLYAKWEKVNNITKQNKPIEIVTKYQEDDTLDNGKSQEIEGKAGEKEVVTTYTVTPITGELTNPVVTEKEVRPMTPKIIKIGTKPKLSYSKRGDDVIKSTTTYKVNPSTGEISESKTEEIAKKGVLKDKVQIINKKDGTTIKEITKYILNEKTGETTETKEVELLADKGSSNKQEELPELKVAILKDSKNNVLDVLEFNEKPKEVKGYKYTGKEEVDGEGNKVYVYDKKVETSKSDDKVPTVEEPKPFAGGVNPAESVVTEELKPFEGGVNSAESVVTEELKPKVELSTVGDYVPPRIDKKEFLGGVNSAESVVTEEPKPFEGGVNPVESVVTEEPKPFEGGVNPVESVVTEESKPFAGGVNPAESVVTEELKPFEGGVNSAESVVTEELKPFEGGVNPAESVVTEELKPFESGVNSVESAVTEELKPLEGGVNSEEAAVREELKPYEGGVNSEVASASEKLPELKVAILKDTEGNVLDVLEISAKPKELKGYRYTEKEEVDGEGNKIYIYEKEKSEVTLGDEKDKRDIAETQGLDDNISQSKNVENKKGEDSTERILPKTGETPAGHGVLGGMLLAATIMLTRRKKQK